MSKFKVGDKVRATDSSVNLREYGIYYGKTYEVEYISEYGTVALIGISGNFFARRFELVESAKPEVQPKPSFKTTVEELAATITYKPGWSIIVGEDGERLFLQVSVNAFAEASMDSVKRDGTRAPWKGGKRYLSPHMCKQELVGVAFDLIKSAEMHEVHEWFRYKGRSIYNPHLDPDALAELAGKASSFVCRKNAMSMDEGASG